MNREIKFRAWNRLINKMTPPFSLQGVQGLSVFDWGVLDVMQFTGLIDRNGKEIYEGDLGKVKERTRGGVKKYKETAGLVHWKDKQATWFFKFGRTDLPLYFINDNGLEIIGNVYENPELL